MKKQHKIIDVKKPLSEPKFEIIAQERAKGQSKTKAYMKAYPDASYDTAKANSGPLIESKGIDLRALQLLTSQGLTEGKLAKRLNELTDSAQDSTALQAVSKGFDLLGYGKQDKQSEASYNPTAIIINIVHPSTQPPDTIEVTPSNE